MPVLVQMLAPVLCATDNVSCDVCASGITWTKSYCIPFLSPWPKEFNDAIDDPINIIDTYASTNGIT